MISQVNATVTNGVLQTDERVPLADQTRVRLTIEPIGDPTAAATAWQSLCERLKARPLHAAGLRYTRDQLHDRG